MIIKKTASLFLVFAYAISLIAQSEKINSNKDSSEENVLNLYNLKIEKIEKQHILDSIKKVELEIKLKKLQSTDNLKKEELENQIQELKNKDLKRLEIRKAKIDSLRNTVKGYPVRGFFNDTLFLIYTKFGSFSASYRASATSDRIKSLSENFNDLKDSIYINDLETNVDILSGETILMSVSDNDALWNNTTRQELADTYKKIISGALVQYKKETNLLVLAKEAGIACVVLLLFGVLIFYINKLFSWIAAKIKGSENIIFKGIKIKNYTVLDSKKEVNVILTANTFIKWIFICISIYIALPILFGIFPWTKNLADQLFGYILTPIQKIALGFWNYLPNLITIIVIIFVFRLVLKGLYYLKTEIELSHLQIPGFYPDWASPTYQIIRVLLIAFLVIVIFPYLPGSESPVFRGVSVFLGFLFTFGSAGSLSNIVAGIILTYMRLFKIGDRVKIGEITGDVIEKSLLVTRVRTVKNEIVSIPNSTIMNSYTVNYTSDAPNNGLIIHTTVTIGYDVPWRDIHQALIDAALKTNYVMEEPKPFVLQTSLDDFYVSYQINVYTHEASKQSAIYSDLHQKIQDICNERGIEIMSPHYRASRDGNTSTIPANYLPKDYKAPGFNVNIHNTDTSENK